MGYTTDIRDTRVGGGDGGGQCVRTVEFSGDCGNTWVSWTYGTFRVAVFMVLWNSGFMVSWIFGSSDSIGTSRKQKSRFVRFCESFCSSDIS
jgi:hypothetical protein